MGYDVCVSMSVMGICVRILPEHVCLHVNIVCTLARQQIQNIHFHHSILPPQILSGAAVTTNLGSSRAVSLPAVIGCPIGGHTIGPASFVLGESLAGVGRHC